MKNPNMLPLYRGAFALRACVEFVALPGLERQGCAPKCRGLEVVEVLAVVGDRVTWTNHKKSEFGTPGVAYVHTSDRRELIALDAIEFITAGTEEEPPLEVAGSVPASLCV